MLLRVAEDRICFFLLGTQSGMKRHDLINVFLRSLFIQVSLNFRGMQNLGFAFAIVPVVSRFRNDKPRIAGMLARHLQSFNTHPYLAGSIIGSVVRLEEVLMRRMTVQRQSFLRMSLWGLMQPLEILFFGGR